MRSLIKIFLASLFTVLALTVSAQSSASISHPIWIGKDVQKVNSKDDFNVSHLSVQTIDHPALITSKLHNRNTSSLHWGNVKSQGYPVWTFSKGTEKVVVPMKN